MLFSFFVYLRDGFRSSVNSRLVLADSITVFALGAVSLYQLRGCFEVLVHIAVMFLYVTDTAPTARL
jgi:hypothetical protein